MAGVGRDKSQSFPALLSISRSHLSDTQRISLLTSHQLLSSQFGSTPASKTPHSQYHNDPDKVLTPYTWPNSRSRCPSCCPCHRDVFPNVFTSLILLFRETHPYTEVRSFSPPTSSSPDSSLPRTPIYRAVPATSMSSNLFPAAQWALYPKPWIALTRSSKLLSF